MWRSAELTKDYKEGDKSLQLRLEDDTVSVGHEDGIARVHWTGLGGMWWACVSPADGSFHMPEIFIWLLIIHLTVLGHELLPGRHWRAHWG